jgi:hypothetical protein
MYLYLGDLCIELECDDERVVAAWRSLFEGWPGLVDALPGTTVPDISLQLKFTAKLPPLPAEAPFFTADLSPTGTPLALLSGRWLDADTLLFNFHELATVTLPMSRDSLGERPLRLKGFITSYAIAEDLLEYVTFCSLAPLLRRRGYYLLHAFAATLNGQAILIAGPSGSGKTTTGLSLIGAAWGFLTNDLAVLRQRPDGIHALPVPNKIGVRPFTLELLPWLKEAATPSSLTEPSAQRWPLEKLGVSWSEPGLVTQVWFPSIIGRGQSYLTDYSTALSLGRLIEESVERWDTEMIASHLALLHSLVQQSRSYKLHLGENLLNLNSLGTL